MKPIKSKEKLNKIIGFQKYNELKRKLGETDFNNLLLIGITEDDLHKYIKIKTNYLEKWEARYELKKSEKRERQKIKKAKQRQHDVIRSKIDKEPAMRAFRNMGEEIGFKIFFNDDLDNNLLEDFHGIYIIMFTNKAVYVGQSIHVIQRLKEHFRKHDNRWINAELMSGSSFFCLVEKAAVGCLDSEEKRMIAKFRSYRGWDVLNIEGGGKRNKRVY